MILFTFFFYQNTYAFKYLWYFWWHENGNDGYCDTGPQAARKANEG